MVRFARAHGSKGSNERVPEEATPWHDLKEQLLAVSSTTDDQESSQLSERKPFVFQKTTDNTPIKWAEFEPNDEAQGTSKIKGEKETKRREKETITLVESVPKKRKKKSKECDEKDATHKISSRSLAIRKEKPTAIDRLCKNVMKKCAIDPSLVTSEKTKKEEAKLLKKQRRAEKRKLGEAAASDDVQEEKSEHTISKKALKRKRQLQKKTRSLPDNKGTTTNDSISDEKSAANPIKFVGVISKRQKRNLKNQLKNKANPTQLTEALNNLDVNSNGTSTSENVITKASKRKNELGSSVSLQSKQHKRRKPEPAITVMQFNGKDVEVVQFDGFPIRKQDADHLTELRKQMVENLIPEKEINHTMKLERRKAEKALARERKKVCFHCRKSGHNLSECPELGDAANHEAPGSGICYKCGSTEHTHFECRVYRGNEFNFAKCFICKEQGHISKQCPDNPRGLYPKGGGCKVCGDVTHLKKDCPDLRSKKEEKSITLNTVQGNGLELLDEDMNMEESQPVACVPAAKVVRF